MIDDRKVLAIIPARGGSKRLPRKNVLHMAGKPLISWTIDAAQASKYIDEVFVSTDDVEIASVALEHGIDIPYLRPKSLSNDKASSESVISHTLENFESDADIIVLLQPTSPLRTSLHIDDALELFIKKSAQSVISVTPAEHSPLWMNTLNSDGSMDGFLREEFQKSAQTSDLFYRLNGAIYILDRENFFNAGKIEYSKGSYAYVMNNISSIDIDELLDFEFAHYLLKNKKDLLL